MSSEKYKELDDAICVFIGQGRGHPIYSQELDCIARPLLASNKTPFPVSWRLIDRRMQAMRKSGRLVYERIKGGGHGKWRVSDAFRGSE